MEDNLMKVINKIIISIAMIIISVSVNPMLSHATELDNSNERITALEEETDSLQIYSSPEQSIHFDGKSFEEGERFAKVHVETYGLICIEEKHETVHIGDLVFEEHEKVFSNKTSQFQADDTLANKGYNSKDVQKTVYVYHNSNNKLLMKLFIEATFKYNGKDTYCSEHGIYGTNYNGSSIEVKGTATSKKNKGATSRYNVDANIHGIMNGVKYNYKRNYKYTCTKKGKITFTQS